MTDESVRVFLSYAREDEAAGARLANDLVTAGVTVWKDTSSIGPGQEWQPRIAKAVSGGSYFLVLLSRNSVEPKSYVLREVNLALTLMKELPAADVFIIPAQLEAVTLPRSVKGLQSLQMVNLFPEWDAGVRAIRGALKPRPPVKQRSLFVFRWLGALLIAAPLYGYTFFHEREDDTLLLLLAAGAPVVLCPLIAAAMSSFMGRSATRLGAAIKGAVAMIFMLLLIFAANGRGR
jgi:hypothetical protein